ncbi:MAG TPA: hypothetical protein VFK57_10675 [Vicinamibacterales bacterium]|nr:hypothetical protein [Vicinamibacterales bacterium]
MTPVREAVVLPLLLLTIALAGGLRPGARVELAPPTLFALMLASLLLAALVRSGALATDRLLHASRGALANANGAVVLFALFAATAQVLTMLTPGSGLPLLFVDVFLFVLLLNTLAAVPDRTRLLRSLAITLGSALAIKFIVLAAVSGPADTRLARVVMALFDVATFGGVAQEPQPASAGYLAFATVAAYLVAVALLPHARVRVVYTTELARR